MILVFTFTHHVLCDIAQDIITRKISHLLLLLLLTSLEVDTTLFESISKFAVRGPTNPSRIKLEISLSFILVLQLLVMPSSLIRKSQTKAFHESFTRYNPTFLTINMFHLVKEVSY